MLLLKSYLILYEFFLASPALEAHLCCLNKVQMWLERNRRKMKPYLSTKEMQKCLRCWKDSMPFKINSKKNAKMEPFDWLGLNLSTMYF